jgi:hypothetical protein
MRFGRWVVLRFAGRAKGVNLWRCRCDCGTERDVRGNGLGKPSRSVSCGCYGRELVRANATHGEASQRTPEYSAWSYMKQRCTNPKAGKYALYGGRGIRVCARWLNSYESFLADMGRRPSDKHSLGRINSDGDYSPENCRWESDVEQNRNTSRNHVLTLHGETRTLAEWAQVTGLHYVAIRARLARGWTVEEALTLPNGHSKLKRGPKPRPLAESPTAV